MPTITRNGAACRTTDVNNRVASRILSHPRRSSFQMSCICGAKTRSTESLAAKTPGEGWQKRYSTCAVAFPATRSSLPLQAVREHAQLTGILTCASPMRTIILVACARIALTTFVVVISSVLVGNVSHLSIDISRQEVRRQRQNHNRAVRDTDFTVCKKNIERKVAWDM